MEALEASFEDEVDVLRLNTGKATAYGPKALDVLRLFQG